MIIALCTALVFFALVTASALAFFSPSEILVNRTGSENYDYPVGTTQEYFSTVRHTVECALKHLRVVVFGLST